MRKVNSRLLLQSTLDPSSPIKSRPRPPARVLLQPRPRLLLRASRSTSPSPRCAPLTRPQWHSFLEALRTCLTAEEAEFSRGSRSLSRGWPSSSTSGARRPSSRSATRRPLRLRTPSRGAVTALVRAVDAAAALCGIPPLRDERRRESEFVPHVSLGWVAGDESAGVEEAAAAATAAAEKVEEEGERMEEQGEETPLRELSSRSGAWSAAWGSASTSCGPEGARRRRKCKKKTEQETKNEK